MFEARCSCVDVEVLGYGALEVRRSGGGLPASRRGGIEVWSWRFGGAPQACRCGGIEVRSFEGLEARSRRIDVDALRYGASKV